jgi:hypothetical protein
MIKLLLDLLGILLIAFGLILFWTPIPVGAVMVPAGLALLIANSSRVRGWIARRRADHPQFDDWMRKASRHSPPPARRILSRTDPRRRDG